MALCPYPFRYGDGSCFAADSDGDGDGDGNANVDGIENDCIGSSSYCSCIQRGGRIGRCSY